MKNEEWTKYTFICDPDECDTLIEVTCDRFGYPSGVAQITCPCGRKLDVLSVQDATINIPTKEREQMLDNLEASIDFEAPIDPRIEELNKTIENKENALQILRSQVSSYSNQVGQLREYLVDNGEDMELHAEDIANIFDIELTKTIEFEATVVITGSVDVSIFDSFDLDSLLSDSVYVDSNNGDIEISDYSVDNVREN
jgi:hypothetical protein